jgi:leader peptidase (prepilin peptidase) / N-methyltransferase
MFVETRPFVLLLFFLLGLAVGSLAVVVVHRDRARIPLLKGQFRCPACGAPAPWIQRIPVVSYLRGRGLRKGCGCKIRIRDPLVELTTGIVWALVAARFGLSWVLPAFLAYATTLIVLSAVDFDERRIPNKVLGPMSIVGALLLAIAALGVGNPGILIRLAIGAFAYALPMLILGLVAPGAMGMGDIKLAAYIGMHLAWFSLIHVLVGAFAAFLIGSIVGLTLVALRKKGRKDTVPFGPSMALGGFLPLFLGPGVATFWRL